MEVHFTPEEETRLQEVAARGGKAAEDVVQAAVRQALEDEARFVEAVQKGIASADRGDLLSHDTVVERIEKRFRP